MESLTLVMEDAMRKTVTSIFASERFFKNVHIEDPTLVERYKIEKKFDFIPASDFL